MSILVGGMFSMCCHMALLLPFMHLYSIFNLRLFLSILFYIKNKSDIETPDRNCQWYQHLQTLFAIFYESNSVWTNFGLCFVLYSTCVRFDLLKRLDVTLCG